jgi:hypothetical protein
MNSCEAAAIPKRVNQGLWGAFREVIELAGEPLVSGLETRYGVFGADCCLMQKLVEIRDLHVGVTGHVGADE